MDKYILYYEHYQLYFDLILKTYQMFVLLNYIKQANHYFQA